MVHFARADGDGFMLCNVWRTEDDMRSFYDAVVLPRLAEAGLAEAGLAAEDPSVSTMWGFARP